MLPLLMLLTEWEQRRLRLKKRIAKHLNQKFNLSRGSLHWLPYPFVSLNNNENYYQLNFKKEYFF